jgi:hypothetical protein
MVDRVCLNGELPIVPVVTYNWVLLIVQTIKSGTVDPELLDKLELAAQVGVERDKKIP